MILNVKRAAAAAGLATDRGGRAGDGRHRGGAAALLHWPRARRSGPRTGASRGLRILDHKHVSCGGAAQTRRPLIGLWGGDARPGQRRTTACTGCSAASPPASRPTLRSSEPSPSRSARGRGRAPDWWVVGLAHRADGFACVVFESLRSPRWLADAQPWWRGGPTGGWAGSPGQRGEPRRGRGALSPGR